MQLENDVAILSLPAADCAMIVSMDTLVEGIHFYRSDPPETISRKLLRVNISDALCKGALPRQAVMSLAIPAWFDDQVMASFCDGLAHDLEHWQVALVGGDITSTRGPLVITIALTAETKRELPVTRAGAREGDGIYVSGPIGRGLVGLEQVQHDVPGHLVAHYRVPLLPPLACADLVADFASASIDVSDGLLAEALHISEASKACLCIELDDVPWAETDLNMDRMLELASGGDDYQILLTVSADIEKQFIKKARESQIPFQRIGDVCAGESVVLAKSGKTVEMPAVRGFQHRSQK